MKLLGLGYVGCSAPQPLECLRFGTVVLGMMPARALPGEAFGVAALPDTAPPSAGRGVADDGTVYLKMDHHQWRIAVRPSDHYRTDFIGLEAANEADFAEARLELRARGVQITDATADELRRRGVRGMCWFRDPAGNRIEIFWCPVLDYSFVSPVGASFRTGPLGMGHLNLFVSDLDASLAFWTSTMGFRLRDFVRFGGGGAYFTGCTPRHHTIALGSVGPVDITHHLLLELDDVDAVGRILDRATDDGADITATLGRHKNDHMLSFYMSSPFGFEIEVGCQGIDVDDETWVVKEFVEGDWWGHRGLTPEAFGRFITKMTTGVSAPASANGR